MISVKHAASCAVIIARLGVFDFFLDVTASLAIVYADKFARLAPDVQDGVCRK